MQGRTRKQALVEGLLAGVIFGTAAIFIRFLQDLNAFSIVFWRLVIACATLAVISLVLGKSLNLRFMKSKMRDLFILGCFLGLHFMFFTFAVKDTTILNATVLVSTVPVFSVVISSLIFKVTPSRFALVGLTVSFLGMCLIAYGETVTQVGSSTSVSPTLRGDLEAVLAALVEAFYLNYGKRIRTQVGILTLMLPIYASAAVVIGILSILAAGTVSVFPVLSEMIFPLLGLGALPTAIAHTLYFSSLSNLKSFETATIAFLEPIGATILGISVFQEVPLPIFAVGAVMVLAGIFFVIKDKNP